MKVNFASPETGYTEAQEAYDALYYEDSEVDEPSDNPEVNVEDNSADQQDFCESRVRPSQPFIPTKVCLNSGDCQNWGDTSTSHINQFLLEI